MGTSVMDQLLASKVPHTTVKPLGYYNNTGELKYSSLYFIEQLLVVSSLEKNGLLYIYN